MKTKKQAEKEAKLIFKELLEKGVLNETKLNKVVTLLVKENAREILKCLTKLIERYESENELIVESPYSLTPEETSEIQKVFESKLGKKLNLVLSENKNLIAGLRIKNGDNVWENSIVSNLDQLKGAIINE